jgi:hypothetical protein
MCNILLNDGYTFCLVSNVPLTDQWLCQPSLDGPLNAGVNWRIVFVAETPLEVTWPGAITRIVI